MKTLGLISLGAALAAGGTLLQAAAPDPSTDQNTTPAANAGKSPSAATAPDAPTVQADAKSAKSTSYPDKETYPHAGTNASPTALIAGASASSGAAIAPSASVIASRIKEWKLGPMEVESEMKAGPIVRTKSIGADEPTGPVDGEALHTLINNRLLADSETIRVSTKDMEVKNGEVTFQAASSSPELLGRAIAVVLDTKGVTKVTAHASLNPTLPGSPEDDAKRIPGAAAPQEQK